MVEIFLPLLFCTGGFLFLIKIVFQPILHLLLSILRIGSREYSSEEDLKVARQLYEQYVYTNEKMPLYCANCRNMGILLSHIELKKLDGVTSRRYFFGNKYGYSFGGDKYVMFMGRCRICKFSATVHRVSASIVPLDELQQFLTFKSLQDFGNDVPPLPPIDDLKVGEDLA